MENRIEKDSFGPIDVPNDRLWGAQTQRSLHHFHISSERMAPELVAALAQVKRAAAAVNRSLGKLPADKADAIIRAADEVLEGRHPSEFPLSVWQTGSGTQSNMNMNEVLANRASELMGGARGTISTGHVVIRGPRLTCRSEGAAGGNRTAAWCRLPSGADLSSAMIKTGTVLRWDRYWKGPACR